MLERIREPSDDGVWEGFGVCAFLSLLLLMVVLGRLLGWSRTRRRNCSLFILINFNSSYLIVQVSLKWEKHVKVEVLLIAKTDDVKKVSIRNAESGGSASRRTPCYTDWPVRFKALTQPTSIATNDYVRPSP